MPRRNRRFFWAWYAYIRWVDDFVDEGAKPQSERTAFVDRQIELVRAGRIPILHPEEKLLDAVLAYDATRGSLLQSALVDLLLSIRFDGQRVGAPADHETLYLNHEREVVSWLYTIAYFCDVPVKQKPPGSEAALGAKTAHVIRDLLRDCEERLINVSRQEIAAYGMDGDDLTHDCTALPVRRWVAAKVRVAEQQLQTGLHDAASCSVFRYRLIVAILIAKYQTYLDLFGSDRFVLKPVTPLHWGHFLKNLGANVAAVTWRQGGSPPAALAIEPLDSLSPMSPARRLLLRWRLLPSRNGAVVKQLADALSGSEISEPDMKKLTRRFVVAYWVGHASFSGINSHPGKSGADQAHLAGLVYAFWSIAVMEFDGLVDDHNLLSADAERLIDAWLAGMGKAITECKHDRNASIGELAMSQAELLPACDRFRRLARALSRCLANYSLQVLDAPQRDRVWREFSSQAQACLAAQTQSRLQRTIDPSHDWSWYLTDILNQKTLGFVLAPFNLWCRNDGADRQKGKLAAAFLTMNSAYFHWQLLDDVADLQVDVTQGLVTAPGYILLAQGDIARRYLEGIDASQRSDSEGTGQLEEAVERSKLLCEWFAASPLCDRHRHFFAADGSPTIEALPHRIRATLANGQADLDVPLPELCAARDVQSRDYLAAMKSRDWAVARRQLAKSGANVRIMLAAQEDAAREMARAELSRLDEAPLRRTLAIIEMLTRHCGAKARRLAVQAQVPS